MPKLQYAKVATCQSCKVSKFQSAKVSKCQRAKVTYCQRQKDAQLKNYKDASLKSCNVKKCKNGKLKVPKFGICHCCKVLKVCQNCLSLSLSCLYQDRHGDTHAALNLHLLPPIQRCAHIFEQPPPCDLCMCSCKQDCYQGRHLKPPTHLQPADLLPLGKLQS